MKTRQKEQAKGSEDGTGRANGRGNKAQGRCPRDKANDPAEPPGQHLMPKVGAQGALGGKGDMNSTGSARPRAETQPRAWWLSGAPPP